MRISDWSSDVCSSDLLAPAGDGDLLAHGRQRLTAARELRYRPVELMVREELREVMSADQPVDGQFLLVHGRQVSGLQRRDDAVVSRHLAVVPGARTLEIGRASCRERVCQSV